MPKTATTNKTNPLFGGGVFGSKARKAGESFTAASSKSAAEQMARVMGGDPVKRGGKWGVAMVKSNPKSDLRFKVVAFSPGNGFWKEGTWQYRDRAGAVKWFNELASEGYKVVLLDDNTIIKTHDITTADARKYALAGQRANPGDAKMAASKAQYRLAWAVYEGRSTAMPKSVAEELIRGTPKGFVSWGPERVAGDGVPDDFTEKGIPAALVGKRRNPMLPREFSDMVPGKTRVVLTAPGMDVPVGMLGTVESVDGAQAKIKWDDGEWSFHHARDGFKYFEPIAAGKKRNPDNFEAAKQVRDHLAAEHKAASDALNSFPKGAMGLTPDSVKNTPEWKFAKQRYDRTFQTLRTWNETFTKRYKKELAAERKSKRNPESLPVKHFYEAGLTHGKQDAQASAVGIGVDPDNAIKSNFEFMWSAALKNGQVRAGNRAKSIQKYRQGYESARYGKKRNPESSAVSMFESFHGFSSGEVIEFPSTLHYHENLWACGVLIELCVELPSGKTAEISFTDPGDMPLESNPILWPWVGKDWIPYKTFPTEIPAQTLLGKLGDKGVYARVDRVRTRLLPTPKYKYEVLVHRDSIGGVVGGGVRKANGKKNPGPFTESGKLISKTAATASKPMNAFMGTVGEVGAYLDGLLGKAVGHKGSSSNSSPRKRKNPGTGTGELSDITYLTANETGNQIYFTGGDQSIDLSAFKIIGPAANKDLITVGLLTHITYHTRKVFDGKSEEFDYIHKMGEKGGKPPTLLYDRMNQRLLVSGGTYVIHKPMLGTSPGIEH